MLSYIKTTQLSWLPGLNLFLNSHQFFPLKIVKILTIVISATWQRPSSFFSYFQSLYYEISSYFEVIFTYCSKNHGILGFFYLFLSCHRRIFSIAAILEFFFCCKFSIVFSTIFPRKMSSSEDERGRSGSDTDYSEVWTDTSEAEKEDEENIVSNVNHPTSDP